MPPSFNENYCSNVCRNCCNRISYQSEFPAVILNNSYFLNGTTRHWISDELCVVAEVGKVIVRKVLLDEFTKITGRVGTFGTDIDAWCSKCALIKIIRFCVWFSLKCQKYYYQNNINYSRYNDTITASIHFFFCETACLLIRISKF